MEEDCIGQAGRWAFTVRVMFISTVRLMKETVDPTDNNPSLLYALNKATIASFQELTVTIGKHPHESYMSHVGIG